jgi:hypothetical protein
VGSKWKNYQLSLFLDSLLPKTQTNVRYLLWKQNKPEANYLPIQISGGGCF